MCMGWAPVLGAATRGERMLVDRGAEMPRVHGVGSGFGSRDAWGEDVVRVVYFGGGEVDRPRPRKSGRNARAW